MTIKAGDKLPEAKFMTPTADGPAPITTDEVFKAKRVALFAVPGRLHPHLLGQAPARASSSMRRI